MGWFFDVDLLKRVEPSLASMKANTALGFALGGAALWLIDADSRRLHRVAVVCAALLVALSATTLAEYLFGADWGIDLWLAADPDTLPASHPGRMSQATAAGFFLIGTALLARLAPESRPRRAYAFVSACFVGALGVLGMLGSFLDVDLVYALPGFGSVAVHTAFGFLVAAGGLIASGGWFLRLVTAQSEGYRLIWLSTSALLVAAVVTGIVSFSMAARDLRQNFARSIELVFETKSGAILDSLDTARNRATWLARWPLWAAPLSVLKADPGNARASAELQTLMAGFLDHGFSSLQLFDAQGRRLAAAGRAPRGISPFQAALPDRPGVRLIWRDGHYTLRTELPLDVSGRTAVCLVGEQPLPGLVRLAPGGSLAYASADFRLCSVSRAESSCFPSDRFPQGSRIVLADTDEPPLSAMPAGFHASQLRDGLRTLGIVGPLAQTGLVAVLDVESDEVYSPIALNFGRTLGLIALLAVAGAGLMWWRMKPLVARLIGAETAALDHLAALRERTALWRSVFEDNGDAILIADRHGQLVEANPRAVALFGYAREALLGQPVEMLMPERVRSAHVAHRAAYARQPETRAMGRDLTLCGVRADGSEFPLDVVLSPIEGESGHTIAIVRDMTEARHAERQLTQALNEKTVLLQELNHRVKNNLQILASLLEMQSGQTRDDVVLSAFEDARGRIRSMALLHQMLHETGNFDSVDLGVYLRRIAEGVLEIAAHATLITEFDLDTVEIDVQRAVACGQIVNEVVNNTCKHAFPDGRRGRLGITLRAPDADGVVDLVLWDDGVGLPPGVEPGTVPTLGLRLIPPLAEQMQAELTLTCQEGTRYEFRFRLQGA